jgi:hypothetical protein
MLIGYPADYRSIDEIGDTIKSFGRLLFWQRDNCLARVIVKARVTDLLDVPHYIIISEGDNFEGVSLSVQCEIIQQNILGGMPQDEDISPGGLDDNFVFPGLGPNQPDHHLLNWAPWPQPQHLQIGEQGNEIDVGNQQQINLQQGDALMADQQVPEDGLAMQEDELQDQPEDIQALQNEPQVSIPAHSGSSDFSSSEVSDASLPDLNLEPPPEHSLNVPDVLLPANPVIAQPQPVDFLGPEVQLEDLMNEEEINAQVLEGLAPDFDIAAPLPNSFNLNLNVGLVRVIYNPPAFGPSNPLTLKA